MGLSPYVKISLAALFAMMFIMVYGTYRCVSTGYVDPLTKTIGPSSLNKFLDGWGISHFLFYGVLAYMFPKKNYLIFIALLGIAWEVLESIFKDHPFYLSECKYTMQTDTEAGWWYGRWEDIVMNSLGMACGVALRKIK